MRHCDFHNGRSFFCFCFLLLFFCAQLSLFDTVLQKRRQIHDMVRPLWIWFTLHWLVFMSKSVIWCRCVCLLISVEIESPMSNKKPRIINIFSFASRLVGFVELRVIFRSFHFFSSSSLISFWTTKPSDHQNELHGSVGFWTV